MKLKLRRLLQHRKGLLRVSDRLLRFRRVPGKAPMSGIAAADEKGRKRNNGSSPGSVWENLYASGLMDSCSRKRRKPAFPRASCL